MLDAALTAIGVASLIFWAAVLAVVVLAVAIDVWDRHR